MSVFGVCMFIIINLNFMLWRKYVVFEIYDEVNKKRDEVLKNVMLYFM